MPDILIMLMKVYCMYLCFIACVTSGVD